MNKLLLALMILIGAMGLSTSPLRADTLYTFSFTEMSGSVTGIVTGTLDLSFVDPGQSGTGAADSLVLTSIPAAYGSLVGGDVVTNWADQADNIFTVTNGVITSFEFLAVTASSDPADLLCLNSTVNSATSGTFTCPAGLNELHANVPYGYNFNGLAGVTFSPAAVPEPGAFALLAAGLFGLLALSCGRLVRLS